MDNLIYMNEEIFLFFKKIFAEKNKDNEPKKNVDNKDSKKFIFHNKEENFDKNIKDNVITEEEDYIIFNYKGIAIKQNFLEHTVLILQKIYSIHDDYFNCFNFNLENLNIDGLIEIIINLIFYFKLDSFKDENIASFLINLVLLLKDLEKDLKIFKDNYITQKKENEINDDNNGIDINENKRFDEKAKDVNIGNNINNDNNIIIINNNA